MPQGRAGPTEIEFRQQKSSSLVTSKHSLPTSQGQGMSRFYRWWPRFPQVFWAAHTETNSSPASQEILKKFLLSKISLPHLPYFETLHSLHLNSISNHDTYQYTFDRHEYSIILLLRGSTSFKPSLGPFKPKFKIWRIYIKLQN